MMKIRFICSDALYEQSQGAQWPQYQTNYIFDRKKTGSNLTGIQPEDEGKPFLSLQFQQVQLCAINLWADIC